MVQWVKYCSRTFSRYKSTLCTEAIIAVSHSCTLLGQLPDQTCMDKMVNQRPCKDLSKICTFLSTVGVCCIFIQNFAKCANALVNLTQKGIPFEFSLTHVGVQVDLKQALLNFLTLWPIDYQSESPVIIAVDTSQIAVRFYLCQVLRTRQWCSVAQLELLPQH